MKKLLLLSIAFSSLLAQAENEKTEQMFAGIAPGQSICYGVDYSPTQLKNRPKQTVARMRVRMQVEKEYGTRFIFFDVSQKNQPNKRFVQGMSCHDYNGEVFCGVECDGGSVVIASRNGQGLTIKNNGFILVGGCGGDGGEEEETIYLEKKRNGDDVFRLTPKPLAECTKANFN